MPAETPAKQNNFNNTKALINQLKSLQNDNMTQIAPQVKNISSPVTPRPAYEIPQALDQKSGNSLNRDKIPHLAAPKTPEPKQVTISKLPSPEPILPTLNPAQTKALPLSDNSYSIQQPNVVTPTRTETTLIAPSPTPQVIQLAPVTFQARQQLKLISYKLLHRQRLALFLKKTQHQKSTKVRTSMPSTVAPEA
ncbi:MAG: hypothetical protein MRQ13_00435 [Candidatus Midichloria sp.]|nr:hypothetical protein [Candidatus Midichloria sp.]